MPFKLQDPLSVMVLDDEPASVNVLTTLLKGLPGIRLLGGFTRIAEAEVQLVREIPDIFFLDIKMPLKTGLELVDEWRSKGIRSEVVFVTAYEQYAVAAIRKSAADYLVKPVDEQELIDCLMRLRCRIQAARESGNAGVEHRVRFNNRTGCIFIDPRDILFIRAEVNYSHIFKTDGTRSTVTVHLGKVEELIGNPSFVRINRSLLVNSSHIREIKTSLSKVIFDVDNENRELPVPRSALGILNDL